MSPILSYFHLPFASFAMEFLGRPFSEPKLITVASGYEAVSAHRKSPATTPALAEEKW